MAEFIAEMNMGVYLPLMFLVLILQIIASKKILFAWFDPISIYLFMNSFGLAFVMYLWIDKEISLEDLISFSISTGFLFVGMNLGNKQINLKGENIQLVIQESNINSRYKYSRHLYIFIFISLIILFIANLFLIAIFGTLPFLSSDVDAAKVAARGPGLGIIYRINGALLPTSLAIVSCKLFNPLTQLRKNESLILYCCLIILVFLLISSGDKSSVLTIANILAYLFLFNTTLKSDKAKIIPRIIFFFLSLGIVIVILTFSKAALAGNYVNIENGLLVRFVAAGESFYYFYKYNLIKTMSLTPLDYIIDSLNPFLSLLKIGTYKDALGSRMITEAIGLDVGKFGTNPQYQVEGAIYFGTIGSFFYSILVGYSLTRIRNLLLEKVIRNPNQLNLVVYCLISHHLLSLLVDSTFLYVTIYSIIIIALPIFILISIIFGHPTDKVEAQ
jgi:oligosaccharide repeat unit polymerase